MVKCSCLKSFKLLDLYTTLFKTYTTLYKTTCYNKKLNNNTFNKVFLNSKILNSVFKSLIAVREQTFTVFAS